MPARNASLAAFGRAVREIRVDHGLSQEQLGARSGVNRTFVGGLERGERNPTYETLIKVAGGLDVDLAELVGLADRYRLDGDRS